MQRPKISLFVSFCEMRMERLELSRNFSLDSKSSASTNYATSAVFLFSVLLSSCSVFSFLLSSLYYSTYNPPLSKKSHAKEPPHFLLLFQKHSSTGIRYNKRYEYKINFKIRK